MLVNIVVMRARARILQQIMSTKLLGPRLKSVLQCSPAREYFTVTYPGKIELTWRFSTA
jgi:hypothetical protein